MLYLKQSTTATVKIGPFLDSTDGVTAETGLTIEQADVRLSKNGGNMAAKTEATTCTHDELGYYDCPLDATDTATLGRLQLMVAEAGAVPVWHEFTVVTANVYDTLCSTDAFDVNLVADQSAATVGTVNALAAGAVDSIIDEVVEGTLTLRGVLRILLSAEANETTGGGTNTLTSRDVANSKARITKTVDANGNCTTSVLDGT